METITEREICDIMNCLNQFSRTFKETNQYYSITVWFPKMANRLLMSNTPNSGFAIIEKRIEDYTRLELINKIRMLHDNGLVPIEVIKDDAGFLFALPKEAMLSGDLTNVIMVEAEDYIPDLSSCYFDTNNDVDMTTMDDVD